MKVLILTNEVGGGHNSTAKAIREQLAGYGAICRILDTYKYINPVLYKTLSKSYLISTSLMPSMYGGIYHLAEIEDEKHSKSQAAKVSNSILALKLKKYFAEEFNPDIIICTHVLSAQIINVMKEKGQLNSYTIGIITDYTIHPYWRKLDYLDGFVIASELLIHQAITKGIPRDKLLPFGIPIHPKFLHAIDKKEARLSIGVDPNSFTVLLMSGSMGYGNIVRIIKKLDNVSRDFQIIAVCGNNKRAKKNLESMQTKKRLQIYGFVENVEVLMSAADCIITKPGGLTTSEALAKNLPMIMVNPIPGQEERNVEFLLNNGLAMKVSPTYPIDEAVYQLFLYPEKLKNMHSNIKLIGKPDATRDLCQHIMEVGGKIRGS